MNNAVTDVIVRVNTPLDDHQFNRLSGMVYRQPGIISFSRNPHTPRALMVVYNAAVTRSRHVLDHIKSFGLEATLVGM